ncbi:TPR-like protein [Ascobolus immersus RN42]|uniref:TPR-like protein n=1 Tax=Ascobolus immersus RN42 TaxID=1160509 RepID=A0A3N4IBY3_ASCIM|nr:TPR-like protein [Ascobolus immersus RN42]
MAEIMRKAQKQLESASGVFSFFGGKEDKYEQAVDLYIQAAASFRVQKQFQQAGQAYEKAAEIRKNNLGQIPDATQALIEAYKSYSAGNDLANASRCLETIVEHYITKGDFRQAANYEDKLGDLYAEGVDPSDPAACQRAITAFRTAADWMRQDNAQALAKKADLKAGDLAAKIGDYDTAIEIYEQAAMVDLNSTVRFTAYKWFNRVIICLLAKDDDVAVNKALGEFMNLDPAFQNSMEFRLLLKLMPVMGEKDLSRFELEFGDGDKNPGAVEVVDPWVRSMLPRLRLICEQEEDLS